ncbi:MAG: hypothetical protein H6559_10535 [Lewinellaceae bacterium]|nr:hypothetical protein [Lewinellaceae bacterium]
MKKSILVLAIFSFLAGALIISCDSPAQRVEAAETNVAEAKDDLAQAKQEYLEDVEKYRLQTAEKIAANNQRIADFNVKIEKEKAEAKAEYKTKVAEQAPEFLSREHRIAEAVLKDFSTAL